MKRLYVIQHSIIVIIQHAALRHSISRWLREMYPETEVVEAETGEEGILHALTRPSSVIIMDGNPGDSTANKIINTIREKRMSGPVILLSVMNDKQTVKKLQTIDADAILDEREIWTKLPLILHSLLVRQSIFV